MDTLKCLSQLFSASVILMTTSCVQNYDISSSTTEGIPTAPNTITAPNSGAPNPNPSTSPAISTTDRSVLNVNHDSCENPDYVRSLNNTSDPLFFPEQCMKLLCHFGWKNFDTRFNPEDQMLASTRGQFVDLESQNGTQWSEMQSDGSMGSTFLIYQGWHQQYLLDNIGENAVNPPLVLANSSILRAKSLSSNESYVDVYNTHGTELSERYSDDEFLFRVYFTRNQSGELIEDGIRVRGDDFITRGCVRMAHIPAE